MAMLRLHDGRDLKVVETVSELLEVLGGAAVVPAAVQEAIDGGAEVREGAKECKMIGEKMLKVHEIRRTVKRKFMTPVDTKAEFAFQVLPHVVHVDTIMDIQPDVKVAPVHGEEHAGLHAVSGPFKHDYDQHVFGKIEPDCGHVEEGVVVDGLELVATEPSIHRGMKDEMEMVVEAGVAVEVEGD